MGSQIDADKTVAANQKPILEHLLENTSDENGFLILYLLKSHVCDHLNIQSISLMV